MFRLQKRVSCAIMNFLPAAGVFTEDASDAFSTMVAFTGLLCGAAHYGAILARRKKRRSIGQPVSPFSSEWDWGFSYL
jgi:hypothetical protein